MLATYLKTPLTLERYRFGPAGPHLDRFTDWLEVRGYQPDRIQHLLRGVHCFSRWAHSARLPLQALDATALEAFRHYLHSQQRLHYPSGNYSHLFMGARHFVTFLASTGQSTSLASIPPVSSDPQLFVEFRHWMDLHRGTTAATVNNYRLTLLDLLETLGESPAQYTPRALRAFILDRASRHGIERAKTLVTAVRMFLRFLIAGGHCAPGLDYAIPTIARWRRASLPTYLSAEAVECVIASCDLTTPLGVRDRRSFCCLPVSASVPAMSPPYTFATSIGTRARSWLPAKTDDRRAYRSPKRSGTPSCTTLTSAPRWTTRMSS